MRATTTRFSKQLLQAIEELRTAKNSGFGAGMARHERAKPVNRFTAPETVLGSSTSSSSTSSTSLGAKLSPRLMNRASTGIVNEPVPKVARVAQRDHVAGVLAPTGDEISNVLCFRSHNSYLSSRDLQRFEATQEWRLVRGLEPVALRFVHRYFVHFGTTDAAKQFLGSNQARPLAGVPVRLEYARQSDVKFLAMKKLAERYTLLPDNSLELFSVAAGVSPKLQFVEEARPITRDKCVVLRNVPADLTKQFLLSVEFFQYDFYPNTSRCLQSLGNGDWLAIFHTSEEATRFYVAEHGKTFSETNARMLAEPLA